MVEEVFKIEKYTLSIALSMILFIAAGSLGFVLLIIPGILFLVNFAFVPIIFASDKKQSVFDYYKQSHEEVKGYRGKLLWLILIFFFVLVLLYGLGVLLSFLFGLIFPIWALTNSIWFVGAEMGLVVFLILILPVLLVTLTDFRNAVLLDRETAKTAAVAKEIKESEPTESEEDEVEKIDGETSSKVKIESKKKKE
jgi:flagellar basal body-associated protein FliL